MSWKVRRMVEHITVRPAVPSEAEVIASMWDQTSRWLKDLGSDQWQYPADMEKISRDVKQGTAYVAHRYDRYFGTITLDGFADPEFWTADDATEDALYAHRIITLPSARGHGIGSALLDWASQKAYEAGKRWLRVDVWKTNKELHRYYEQHGFKLVRTVDLPHRRSGALYQRIAGTTLGRGPQVTRLENPVHDMNGNPITEGYGGRTNPT